MRQLLFASPLGFGLPFAADRVALAALPLVAAWVLGAGPGRVGASVAAQGAAWLLVALPAGALVDRWPRRRVLALAPLGAAVLAALAAYAAPPGFVERHAPPAANALG